MKNPKAICGIHDVAEVAAMSAVKIATTVADRREATHAEVVAVRLVLDDVGLPQVEAEDRVEGGDGTAHMPAMNAASRPVIARPSRPLGSTSRMR